jgi:hypothetical protein
MGSAHAPVISGFEIVACGFLHRSCEDCLPVGEGHLAKSIDTMATCASYSSLTSASTTPGFRRLAEMGSMTKDGCEETSKSR